MQAKAKGSGKKKAGIIGAAALIAVLSLSGFAMTDVIGVPSDSHAGDGQAPIENEVVTNVHYSLDTTDASTVDSIDFDMLHPLMASPGGSIFTQPVSAGAVVAGGQHANSTAGAWYACLISGTVNGISATPTHPVCVTTTALTPLKAVDIDQVRVVAAD